MSKLKKIIFKVPEFPHLSETFIIAQIITAIELGYEVKILIGKLMDINESLHSKLLTEYSLMDKVIIEDYSIPKNKVLRLIKALFLVSINFNCFKSIINFYKEHDTFSLTWIYQWCFFEQFNTSEIFHVQYGTNSNTLAILKKTGFFKPKLIVTFHGHDAFFPINGFIKNNGYYDNLFKSADLITANTPYLANKIIELGCSKELISIVPVGVNTDFFYASNNKTKSTSTLKLITVGRLDRVKGHHFCVEIVNQLISKGIDVTLTIIGEGIERENLENLINKYQLKEKIFMIGKKSQEEVRQILWEHDVYLLTAVALPDGRRETQGLATLEAQACGLPVVVFDSGGVKYTVDNEKSGFICDEYDVKGSGCKIEKFIEDSSLLTKMGKQAVIFVHDNFSQKIIDKKWDVIYNNLSNGK